MEGNFCSIVCFIRDLRLDDNLSLFSTLQLKKKIQPVFIFDTDILKLFTNKRDRRLSFIAEAFLICIMILLKRKASY